MCAKLRASGLEPDVAPVTAKLDLTIEDHHVRVVMPVAKLADFGGRNEQIRRRVIGFSQRLQGKLDSDESVVFVSEPKTIYVVVFAYLLITELSGPHLWFYLWEPSWRHYWTAVYWFAGLSTVFYLALIYYVTQREGFFVTTARRVIRYPNSIRLRQVSEHPIGPDDCLVVEWDPKVSHAIHRYSFETSRGETHVVGRYHHAVYEDLAAYLE